jgi:hypothetical protein
MAFCSQTERPDEKIGKQPFYPRSSRRLSTFECLLRAIVAWMARQKDKPSLSEAISRLVQLGLTLTRDQDRQKRRARKMAGRRD